MKRIQVQTNERTNERKKLYEHEIKCFSFLVKIFVCIQSRPLFMVVSQTRVWCTKYILNKRIRIVILSLTVKCNRALKQTFIYVCSDTRERERANETSEALRPYHIGTHTKSIHYIGVCVSLCFIFRTLAPLDSVSLFLDV